MLPLRDITLLGIHYVPRNGCKAPESERDKLTSIRTALLRSVNPFGGCQELWGIYRISTIVVQLED
jgi:hypothetical protein